MITCMLPTFIVNGPSVTLLIYGSKTRMSRLNVGCINIVVSVNNYIIYDKDFRMLKGPTFKVKLVVYCQSNFRMISL